MRSFAAKNLYRGSAELSVNLGFTGGHGSCSSTYDTSRPSAQRQLCELNPAHKRNHFVNTVLCFPNPGGST